MFISKNMKKSKKYYKEKHNVIPATFFEKTKSDKIEKVKIYSLFKKCRKCLKESINHFMQYEDVVSLDKLNYVIYTIQAIEKGNYVVIDDE